MTDISSPFTPEGIQFAFDSTTIKAAMTCPRLYQYTIVDNWTRAGGNVHLWFGGHFATALEHYYKFRALGQDLDEALCAVVHEALINTWEYKRDESGAIVEPRIGAPVDYGHTEKTRETLIRSIIWYVDQFHDDDIKVVILSDGTPAVEHSFKLPIDNGNFYCGHIDRLVDWGGDLYLMDQKTTGSTITPRFFKQFDLDMQMSGYAFAGKAIYDMPIKGVIIDGAQIAVGFTRFERNFTHRSESQLEEWYDDLMFWIESIQVMNRERYYPMNTTSCDKYSGCAFREVCSRAPHVRENFLKADFVKRKQWNPLEAR